MKSDITLIFPTSLFLINQTTFPPLGIMYLSAYLRMHGFNVQCLDFGFGHTKEMAEADIIGISFCTSQRHEAYKLVDYYKGKGCTTIAGGPHPTHMTDECIDNGFDWVIKGYGEENLAWIMGKNIIATKDVDNYPFPDRDSLPIKDYNYKIDGECATTIMTSRGCSYSCSFCAKIDNSFEMQSAERTISEIEHIYDRYGIKAFMIFDDVFIADKRRLNKLTDAFYNSRYKFRCFARSNLIDENVCSMLSRMGVVEVGIGIESGSDKILKLNRKNATSAHNTKAVEMLHKYGIRVKAFLIVGLPGEDHYTISETEKWIIRAKPDDIDVTVFQPLPGSDIFANPDKYGVKFDYKTSTGWFKGIPGKYDSNVSTERLNSWDIVEYRDMLEKCYKDVERIK